MIDPITAIEIAKIIKDKTEKNINEERIKEIASKLDYVYQTCNELILRDIRSAFKSLEDYVSCKTDAQNKDFLNKIEVSFMRNTGLNPDIKIGDIKNSDIIAYSYYGLAFIKSELKEFELANRYLLRMFESGSRHARNTLSPEYFDNYIKPYCSECYDKYNQRVKNMANSFDYVRKKGLGIYCATLSMGAFLLGHALGPGPGNVLVKETEKYVSKTMDNIDTYKEWGHNSESLKEDLEIDLDKKTSEIAKELLKNI